ncbi:calpain-3 isoform X3 [Hippocampus comes]|uniref:calpain-3 isoform X1 n=1 Tax=Hippocampus comes TaxID=109280 RepID=UPI00094EBFA6|nr:PREDICTED: calpain-3-like isoform X1 [Hippocampus comes]XP_019748312.1 PREDICTED: calpain-3-like isoform X2 [Hippocampus comes]XP_019748313.1 PREDICTED: calpain-3-like isoform X3 [Hippocampus comes]
MEKSPTLPCESEGSLQPPPPDDDDASSACSDELLGSQSRRWLAELLAADDPGVRASDADVNGERMAVGRDGLFVDYHFPLGELEMKAGVKWKRPKELCSSPQFTVDGASRLDVRQGKLSDCWLLSAIASLAVHQRLLRKVVPPGQTFQDGYNGSFIFRFWQYGQWEDVRIDDLLPTYGNNLIYLSSPEKREFWSSLLEKAYAKLKGGYRALDMGFPHEAMVDMTGGVAEVLSVAVLPRELPAFLAELLAKGALINCANTQGPVEYRNDLGIMFRHAYSLTAVEKVQTTYGPVDLVRILNPWGNTEWLGPWSDRNGPEWNTVSAEEQKRLHRIQREDGEFWMSVSDFRQNFETMEVCHLADLQNDASVQPWSCAMHHGTWVPHISAGGSPKGGWFWQNPQFGLVLSQVEHGSPEPPTRCAFILALMQKFQRRRGIDLSIALHIYPAPHEGTHLSPEDLSKLRPAMSSSYYSSRREVVLRGHLQPGRYVIIPSTAEPNQQGAFLLRVLTEQGHAATPAQHPTRDLTSITAPHYPHQAALPSLKAMMQLFKKHCNKRGFCKPHHLHSLLTEAIQGGVLAGSEKNLALEHCKSLVVLMDSQGIAQLTWSEFQALWDKIRLWTDIFLVYDKNKTQRLEYKEVAPALKAAGIVVDDLVMQLVGLRYTESDMTISYPGFLYLVMKLESMIHKFHAYDMVGMGCISLNYRQWLHMTIYN